jgi:thiamine-monophosphate kinase
MTVSELSERELIARISSALPPLPPWLVLGIGDDAAVVEPARNRLEVLTVDSIVEGIHFDRRFVPPDAIGHRALAVNLSDLAAMGAEPRLALLSLALPGTLPCGDFDGIAAGIVRLAREHRVHVAGGNLTRSPGPLVVDITVTGTAKRRGVLTRSGARPGDDVYVTGTIGGAAAGLQTLQSAGSHQPVSDAGLCIGRYLYPAPRTRCGLLLGRNRAASACLDLSDGLADGLRQVSESSRVGMVIDAGAIPIEPEARSWFVSRGMDPVIDAIAGGDDYELLFTVPPKRRSRLLSVTRHAGVPITRIGACTAGPGIRLQRRVEGRTVEEAVPHGFGHFR